MLLAKLISSGLASLSVSGLGLYFVPKYSELNSESVDLIYKAEESGDSEKFQKLEKSKDKLLKTLENMNQKFQTVSAELNVQKNSKHKSMTETFEKITKEEEELQVEYEKGKKWLDQIGRIVKGIYGANQKKLQLDAIIGEIDYLNESLAKMYGSFSSWGFALEQFVCAIDNKDQKKKCDNEGLKDWLSKSINGEGSSSKLASSGGGTSASSEALKQLDESKRNLKAKQERIKKLLRHLREQNISKLLEGSLLKAARDSLKQKIELHNQFLKTWNDKGLQESVQKIQTQTSQLNTSYQTLEETHKKWETIKENLSSIYHYSSLIVNSICREQQGRADIPQYCLSNLKEQ